MKIQINPGTARGRVTAPPSKSMAHRMMICAGLAAGTSVLQGISDSQDMQATLDCLAALGAQWQKDGETVTITGIGSARTAVHDDAGAAGTQTGEPVLRCPRERQYAALLYPDLPADRAAHPDGRCTAAHGAAAAGLRAALQGAWSVFCTGGADLDRTGSAACRKLPAARRYFQPVHQRSALCTAAMRGGQYGDDPAADRKPPLYRYDAGGTQNVRRARRVADAQTLYIPGGQQYHACDAQVEGDFSNAAFFGILDAIRPENQVQIDGLPPAADSLQADRVYPALLARLDTPAPCIDLTDCPDLGPILFAAAAAKHGGRFVGTKRLKIKESDRGAAMAEELRKFGVDVMVRKDEVTVMPSAGGLLAPTVPLSGHNDHRIVMSAAVLLTLTGGVIEGAEAVSKSFPDFFDKLQALGIEVKNIEN